MTKQEMIEILAEHKRPHQWVFDTHFNRLPDAVVKKANVPRLISILEDDSQSVTVRRNAAGALGRIGDPRALAPLLAALGKGTTRRCAAIALGTMGAVEALEALEALKSRDNAARWALSQLDLERSDEEVIEALRTSYIHFIKPKVEKLSPAQRDAVSKALCKELRGVLKREELGDEHIWLVISIRYLAPPEGAELLTEALRQRIGKQYAGITVHARRGVAQLLPLGAAGLLVDLAARGDHEAAVTLRKLILKHGPKALEAIGRDVRRLKTKLRTVQRQLETTPHREPKYGQDHGRGTARWRQGTERFAKSLSRTLGAVEKVRARA